MSRREIPVLLAMLAVVLVAWALSWIHVARTNPRKRPIAYTMIVMYCIVLPAAVWYFVVAMNRLCLHAPLWCR